MGLSDIVSRRAFMKTEPETIAENFIQRCKPGKALRGRPRTSVSEVRQLQLSIALITNTHKKRRENQNVCIGHHSLFISLRKCYDMDINDHQIISDLLSEIYFCDGNLQAIFSILLPGHVIRSNVNINIHTLYPGFSTRMLRKHSMDAFEYYLHHVCETNSHLSISGKRQKHILNSCFDCESAFTPLSAACKGRDPATILLLLRYGADAYEKGEDNLTSDSIDTLVSGLNSMCLFGNISLNNDTKEALVEEARKGKLCLRYIFKTVRNIPFSQSNYFQTEYNEEEEKNKAKTYNLHPRLASTIDTKLYSGVRSLQHLCRITIRNRISKVSRHSLPVSISCLELPKVLVNYLDLQSD